MANKLAIGLVIGGAVSSSVGKAFKDVGTSIQKLQAQGAKANVLQRAIGDTIRLRDEWKKAHASGAAGADTLLKKLDANLASLKKQGIEVGRLNKEYRALGQVARSAELKAKGMGQVQAGKESLRSGIGQAAAGAALVAIPTKVSADFQAIVRDISIKAGVANKPEEAQLSRSIIQTSKDTGMARNDVANVVNELVGAGMEMADAISYAPVVSKFAVGQGASGTDTAKMIMALQNNARITNPEDMQRALEVIAYQGQEGSFEASDMAKWFPELLSNMGAMETTGVDGVAQLGAMLQAQRKSAGSSDEAANNLKNFLAKMGSGETEKAYAGVGIDYAGSMQANIKSGKSPMEAAFGLAQKYVEKVNPEKGKQLAEGMAQLDKEVDPAKAQAMAQAMEKTLRTGDLFADMQVKTALMAYMQNKKMYEDLKKGSLDSKGKASGILDKNLDERRESSAQIWKETAQSIDDSMRAVGDAIRPATDAAAKGIGAVAKGITDLADKSPNLVMGLGALAAGVVALGNVLAVIKIGRGLANIVRGSMGAKGNIVQRVFVVNPDSPGVGGGGLDADGNRKGGKGRGAGGKLSVGEAVAKGGKFLKVGGPLAALDAGFKALDTYQNATTQDEKAEGYGDAAGGLAGGLAGAAAGAAIGSVVPIIGTAIGGLIGGALGAWGGGELGATLGKALFGGKEEPVAEVKPAEAEMGQVVRSLVAASTGPQSIPPELQKLEATKKPEIPKIDQAFTFSPQLALTVQGDVKDPAMLAQELMPHLRRQFEDYSREVQSRQLFDAPDVG
jgi:TP901 family phage tail tape measure protein